MVQVCLVNPPYASLLHPSLALGLIKRYLLDAGICTRVIDANLHYAKRAGVSQAQFLEFINHEHLSGEWIFSPAAFPEMPRDDNAYFSLFPGLHESVKTFLKQQRDDAPAFIESLANTIIADNPAVVGCTSTFQQNCASLALLKKIKFLRPDIITMMGGANCEGSMGDTLVHSFEWVDYVFSGECDETIADIVGAMIAGDTPSPNQYSGLLMREPRAASFEGASQRQIARGIVSDVSNVAIPYYDDYFDTLRALDLEDEIRPGLVLETSRGCWWGAKQHCTFCGLNGMGMQFRAKEAGKVFDEICQLSERHQVIHFEMVDNIMAPEYLTSLAPTLAEHHQDFEIFFETKANLKKHQVLAMADAGIRWVQPGLESLHDDFLKLIKKGTTAIQNIASLKWCAQYGVRVFWSLLCNVPGEKSVWYQEMAELIPLIEHLQAPQQNMLKVRYARFSPYFESSDLWGLRLKPIESYHHVYPLDDEELFHLAYFFRNESEDASYDLRSSFRFESGGHRLTYRAIAKWIRAHSPSEDKPELTQVDKGGTIEVCDTRAIAAKARHHLTGLTADIYRLCDSPIGNKSLHLKLQSTYSNLEDSAIDAAVNELVDDSLLLSLNDRYLTLALDDPVRKLPPPEDFPGGLLLAKEKE